MQSTQPAPSSTTSQKPPIIKRGLPLVLCFLFLLSGSSGLIYEVVWLRMLSRTLGSTIYAISTILAVFMGGLALGSFIIGRMVDRIHRPLLLYAILEAGIAISALFSLLMNSWPVPLYRTIYAMAGNSRAVLTLGQVLLVMSILLVPTALMGTTLPTLCAYGARRFKSVGRMVGTLYALNTLGATAGVLLGGFVLIGAIGEIRTILCGVAVNLLVAIVAVAISLRDRTKNPKNQAVPEPTLQTTTAKTNAPRVRPAILLCFAMSGFVSLALEIVWSRMLALYEGTSIYAFSSMLAVMLLGIGLGGWFGGRVDRWKDPLRTFARLQIGVGLTAIAGIAVFAWLEHLSMYLPPLIMVGPSALLLGIGFPVAVRCYAQHGRTIGKNVGELYAWNTVGCILGSLAGGFVLLPLFGAAHTGALLCGFATLSGLILIAVHPRGGRSIALIDLGFVLCVAALGMSVGDPYRTVLYARQHTDNPAMQVFGYVESAAATTMSVGVLDNPLDRRLLVNGCGMTVLTTGNKLMAHLPLWLADSPHDALVICLGMGTTFRSASRWRDIDVTVVELVPAVPKFMRFYHPDAPRVMAQPNAHVVIDDGRNYLLMHDRKFDTITIDPAPPLHSAGTVNLYTVEFFQLCCSRLNSGGVVCLWIPHAPLSECKMIIHSFDTVFPNVSVWAGPRFPGIYLIGSLHPLTDVPGRIESGMSDPVVLHDLVEWDASCSTPQKVLALHLCDRDALLRLTANSKIVTDDHPYTEFPLWRMNGTDAEYNKYFDADHLRSWLNQHP